MTKIGHTAGGPRVWAALTLLLASALVVTSCNDSAGSPGAAQTTEANPARIAPPPAEPSPAKARTTIERLPTQLPWGGRTFSADTFVVAYYGTADTDSLGVLGEADPDAIMARLRAAAEPYEGEQREVRLAYELIVTVADPIPGPEGVYSHDIAREKVKRYLDAARRNNVIVILDLQPGRSDFLEVAKRWEWALREPHVGLALDPEWRVGGDERPGQVIGSVGAREVNRVSTWLAGLVEREALPEKVFMLHQFRTDMLPDIDRVQPRPGLVLWQHVDGFGSPEAKRSTYRTVARPQAFRMGFKLFYDEDKPLMKAAEVLAVRPRVSLVTFQ